MVISNTNVVYIYYVIIYSYLKYKHCLWYVIIHSYLKYKHCLWYVIIYSYVKYKSVYAVISNKNFA